MSHEIAQTQRTLDVGQRRYLGYTCKGQKDIAQIMVKVCKEELTPIMAAQYNNDSGVVLIAGKNKCLEGLRAVQFIKTICSCVIAKAYFLTMVSDSGTKRLRVERTTWVLMGILPNT